MFIVSCYTWMDTGLCSHRIPNGMFSLSIMCVFSGIEKSGKQRLNCSMNWFLWIKVQLHISHRYSAVDCKHVKNIPSSLHCVCLIKSLLYIQSS